MSLFHLNKYKNIKNFQNKVTSQFGHPLFKWLKYIIAIIPFIIIFQRVDFGKLIDLLGHIAQWTILVVLIRTPLVMVLQGVRWWVLLKAFSSKISFLKILKQHFISIFYSTILPTSIAQDILRAYFASKYIDYSITISAAWLHKLIFLLGWILMSTYGLLCLGKDVIPENFLNLIYIFYIIFILILSASFSKKITSPIRKLVKHFLPLKIMDITEKIRQGIYNYRDKKRYLCISIAITLTIQLLFIFGVILIIKGITGKFFFAEIFAFLPIIDILATILPFTPNGIGIREGLFAIMFNYMGLSNTELGIFVLFSLLSYALRTLGGLPILYDLFKSITCKKVKQFH